MSQSPIGSGFGPTTTADDVLAGVDLSGTLIIVTGGSSGIGLETVRAFSAAGATVLVPARDANRARATLAGIERVEVAELDLAALESVQTFAKRFLDSHRAIDILIANAGVMATVETRTRASWELQLATNHLGHFVLTNLLWPALASGNARVVSLSSGGHKLSPIRWDDIQLERGYDKWLAYGQSKTATALFAVGLDRLGQEEGVRAFTVAPGPVRSSLWRHLPADERIEPRDDQGKPIIAWKTPAAGAATSAWAATSPQLKGTGGLYLEHCDVAPIANPSATGQEAIRQGGVLPWAIDPEQAKRLWKLSAALTGVDAFASAAAGRVLTGDHRQTDAR
jgi:NAD(P)-dependent dehydrogenase (short-subunit alcohol dehydrogenase family)